MTKEPKQPVTITTTPTEPTVKAATAKPRRKRNWILPAAIALSLGLTAFAMLRPKGPQATAVNAVKVTQGTLTKTVTGTGNAQAEVSRSLSFSSAGQVGEVRVKVGDNVQKGDILARLDSANAERELQAARAALASARADLTRAEATARETGLDQTRQVSSARTALAAATDALADAQRQLDLQTDLLKIGAVSQQDYRTAKATRDEAQRKVGTAKNDLAFAQARGDGSGRAAIAQAEAALKSAQVRVSNLEKGMSDSVLRSPTAGVISAVNITAGNPAPSTTSAIEITDSSRLYLEVPFDETRATDLRVGQSAKVEFDALPNTPIQATVSRVDPVARTSGQVASVVVRLKLRDAAQVKPGFTGTATVTTARLNNATLLPLETTSEEGGKTQVWKVTPTETKNGQTLGTAQPVTLTIRERDANQAAVEGIQAGDLVITPAPSDLQAGDTVNYHQDTDKNKEKDTP